MPPLSVTKTLGGTEYRPGWKTPPIQQLARLLAGATHLFAMTMQIKGVQMAGLPAKTVRDMLRRLDIHSLMDALFVAARCKVSTRKAKEVIKTLADGGYVEFDHRGRELLNGYRPGVEEPRYRDVDYYKLTDKGIKLRNASAATKMPRTKASQIIVALLKRVEEANAMDFAYRIPTVIVYGSYVRGETFLSDVDIAVELEGKWDSDEERDRREKERIKFAFASGRTFSNFIDQLSWPKYEVQRYLKARTRGLSVHPLDDFIRMQKDKNFAYRVLRGDADRVAAQLGEAVR
jgi:predicted nucleotidyltransferase